MATSVGSISLKMEIGDIQKYIDKMKAAKKSLPQFFRMVVTQMGDAAIDYAIPRTRVRTGRLISSYVLSPIEERDNSYKITVSNSASENGESSYAIYNEFGTRFMAPRLMLTTAREMILTEGPELIEKAFIRVLRGDSSGGYTFKLN